MQVEHDVKKECISWAGNRFKDSAMKDAALKDMSTHFLVIAFLPFQAAEIRQKIKHWGDTRGYMTQCIVSILLYFQSWYVIFLLDYHSAKRSPPRIETSSMTSISTISPSSRVVVNIGVFVFTYHILGLTRRWEG